MSFSLALSPGLQLNWATTLGRLNGQLRPPLKDVQEHNRAYWVVLYAIPFVLNAKQRS